MKDSTRANERGYWYPKRLIDVLLSILGLILSAPLLLLLAAAIKATSRGPIIYRQKRLGLNGVPFTIYKLRTMQVDADQNGPATIPSDSRVTWIGKLIRPTHFDELPQFINILKGDMSCVGPRPRPVEQCEQIRKIIPDYDLRYQLKPGLTGLSQIAENRDDTTTGLQDSFELDLKYLETWSLITDLKIMARTVWAVVVRKGI